MSAAGRTRHLVPAVAVLGIAATVAWLSFTREPADAFLFPRLISGVMLALAAWNAARAALGLSRVGAGIALAEIRTVAPGVLVMLVYVLFAARELGFYVASFVALCSLHGPAPHARASSWVRRVLVALGFMVVIWALFTLLLKVQTPRGLFF